MNGWQASLRPHPTRAPELCEGEVRRHDRRPALAATDAAPNVRRLSKEKQGGNKQDACVSTCLLALPLQQALSDCLLRSEAACQMAALSCLTPS